MPVSTHEAEQGSEVPSHPGYRDCGFYPAPQLLGKRYKITVTVVNINTHDNQVTLAIPTKKELRQIQQKGNSSSFRDRLLCGAVTINMDPFVKFYTTPRGSPKVNCNVAWYRHDDCRVLWHTLATLS